MCITWYQETSESEYTTKSFSFMGQVYYAKGAEIKAV